MLGSTIKFRVSVGEPCLTFYDQVKSHKLYRYLILYIRADNVIDIEKIGMRRCNYEQFLADLRKCGATDCRFGIFDIDYACGCEPPQRPQDHLLLVHWCPEGVSDTKRMLYAAGLKALRDCLGERQAFFKATHASEPTLAQAIEECRSLEM